MLKGSYILEEADNWGVFASVEVNANSDLNVIQAILEEANATMLDVHSVVVDQVLSLIDWGERIKMDVIVYDDDVDQWPVTIIIRKVVRYD